MGQIVFASYWIQAIDWAYATTSSALPRTLYGPSCNGCTKFFTGEIDAVRNAGEHYRGGRISVERTQIQPNDGHFGANAVVDVTLDQAALSLVSPAGKVVEHDTDTGGVVSRTWLKWTGTSWQVVDWKQAVTK